MSKPKKVILFVVEGPSEVTAFGSVFNKIFSSDFVTFDVIHGDMTTDYLVSRDPREEIRRTVLSYIDINRTFKWSDLKLIVQICDTDGAFIPEKYVKKTSRELSYQDDCILAPDPTKIIQRNKNKKQAMNRLSQLSYLTKNKKRVPYYVFYLSRNLEHALYQIEYDLTNEEKKYYAHNFSEKYKNDTDSFITFLKDEKLLVSDSYKETWKYINKDLNSLKRGSNLGLVFDIC